MVVHHKKKWRQLRLLYSRPNPIKMPFSFQVEGAAKDQLVVSLAALLLHDSNVDISSDNIDAVVKASNNTVPAYYSALFSSYIEKAGGVEKFLVGPSAGGAGK